MVTRALFETVIRWILMQLMIILKSLSKCSIIQACQTIEEELFHLIYEMEWRRVDPRNNWDANWHLYCNYFWFYLIVGYDSISKNVMGHLLVYSKCFMVCFCESCNNSMTSSILVCGDLPYLMSTECVSWVFHIINSISPLQYSSRTAVIRCSRLTQVYNMTCKDFLT